MERNEEEEMERNEEEEMENIYIPSFIRGYSDSELVKLLEIFVDPSGNYKSMTREKLEILYKNYLTNNIDETADDVIRKFPKN